MLDGFKGEVTPQQREALLSADARCAEAIETSRQLLVLQRAAAGKTADTEGTDLAALCRQAGWRYTASAREHHLEFEVEVETSGVMARIERGALEEAIAALLENALRYTPAGGQVRLSLRTHVGDGGTLAQITVGDSGIGVPEGERDRLFQPFFRASNARAHASSGTGLGLALVKTVVEAAGGRVAVAGSTLGGAEFQLTIPVEIREDNVASSERTSGSRPLRVVVVGGVAAGPKVASKVVRLEPEAEVTVVEAGQVLSYAGCGLPYYVSGVVRDQRQLFSTPAGTTRDPVFFLNTKNVKMLNRTEAVEIDRAQKRLRVRDLSDNHETWLPYDRLALCTGSRALRPRVPGSQLRNIFTLHGLEDAEGIRAALEDGRARDVAIIGGGLIGVEMAEALVEKGCRVTVVETLLQILPMLDWEMARLVERHLEAKGVKVHTGCIVQAFRADPASSNLVAKVQTTRAEISVDMVILAVGVEPNVDLARRAGLQLGPTGALAVDEFMCTSDPDIFAAGDCVETRDLVTGRQVYVPLGSTANKQGRVAAMNICGRADRFGGVLGTTICRVFEYSVARTGLSERAARDAGFETECVLVPGPDRAHFMPSAKMVMLKVVADRRTGRVLGVQAVGPGECAKRVDVAATAITAGMTADQVSKVDLAYAPPYAEAMDNLITACNALRNKLEGQFVGISPIDVKTRLDQGVPFTFLDVRGPAEVAEVRLPGSVNIPLRTLRGRLGEIDRTREVVTFCQLSLRGYEAAIVLRYAGFSDVKVMDGGVVMWPYEKITG